MRRPVRELGAGPVNQPTTTSSAISMEFYIYNTCLKVPRFAARGLF